jgi:hypothetical protein
MALLDALARGRAAAEARMGAENGSSTGVLRRKTGQMVKTESGYESPEWEIVADPTPLRLAGTAANSAPYKTETPNVSEINRAARVAHFPVSLTELRNDDYLEITAGENAGTVWRLIEATWQDQATARRIPVEQVDRPSEWGQA